MRSTVSKYHHEGRELIRASVWTERGYSTKSFAARPSIYPEIDLWIASKKKELQKEPPMEPDWHIVAWQEQDPVTKELTDRWNVEETLEDAEAVYVKLGTLGTTYSAVVAKMTPTRTDWM